MIVCWLPMTSQGNMLLYVGYSVPKVPTTIHYSESWKVVPYYQSIEGACPKVVAPVNFSIPGNGLEGLSHQLLTFIQTGLYVLQPSQEDSHYSFLKNLQKLLNMKGLK